MLRQAAGKFRKRTHEREDVVARGPWKMQARKSLRCKFWGLEAGAAGRVDSLNITRNVEVECRHSSRIGEREDKILLQSVTIGRGSADGPWVAA